MKIPPYIPLFAASVFVLLRSPPAMTSGQPGDLGQKVIRTMQSKGYELQNINIVGISGMNPDGTKNDNRPDRWNDLVLIVSKDGKVLHSAIGTTEPAWSIVQKPIVPPGAAQLAFGQHKNAYQVGTHDGKSSRHEALVQTGGPVTVLRDVNKNGKRDAGDLKSTGMFDINFHRAGQTPLKTIQGYSAGCIVTNNINDHLRFMQIVKSSPEFQSNRSFRFHATLLDATEVN